MIFIRRGDAALAEYDSDRLEDVLSHELPGGYEPGDTIVRRDVNGARLVDVPLATLETYEGRKLWSICEAALPLTSRDGAVVISAR